MADGLRIRVDADISPAERAFRQVANEARTTGQLVGSSLSSGFNKATPAITKTTQALNKFSDGTKKTKFSMIELSRVVQDLPFGFTGIANNLTQLIPGVGLAGLAFSGLVSALTFSQIGLSAWSRGSKGAKDSADNLFGSLGKVREEQEKFNKAMQEAAEATIGEASKIAELRRTLVDTSNAYNTLTEAVIKSGVAQALFSQKNEAVQKLLADSIGDVIRLQKGTIAFLPDWSKGMKDVTKSTKELYAENKKLADQGIIGTIDPLNFGDPKNITRPFVESAERAKELGKEIFDINKLANILGISFEKFIKPDKGDDSAFRKIIDDAKELAKVLSERSFFKVSFTELPFEDLKQTAIRAKSFIQRALSGAERLKFGTELTFDKDIVDGFRKKIEADQKRRDKIRLNILGIDIPAATTEINKLRDALEKQIQNRPASLSVKVQMQIANLNEIAQEFKNGIAAINKIIQQVAVDSFANIGETLGSAIAGGDLGKGFAAFADIIGTGLQEIGKKMIAISPVILALRKAIETLNPALLLPAGIALVGIGAALKKTVNAGIKGFAQGGLVFGPTLGLIGEGPGTTRSNPEVIAPLDKLRSMLGDVGGGRLQVNVVGRFRGNDILLSNNRTNRTNRRNGQR